MRVLIVIGAGASFDCWPPHVVEKNDPSTNEKLPLANNLFAPFKTQDEWLSRYNLVGLAALLRQRLKSMGKAFDVEAELEDISIIAERAGDFNRMEDLFKTRFYLHRIISLLTGTTLDATKHHTVYVDLLNKLKNWIDESPSDRFVDIVTFNYDYLIEVAMRNVYSYDWNEKKLQHNELNAYIKGKNLKIYKPHGSISWGRVVQWKDKERYYNDENSMFPDFNNLTITDNFEAIEAGYFVNRPASLNKIPAIAVPLKSKNDFQECPKSMYEAMIKAMKDADKLITFGWKGADTHFTKLLKSENTKIDEIHVVSPNGDTELGSIYREDKITYHKEGFSFFVSNSSLLEIALYGFK